MQQDGQAPTDEQLRKAYPELWDWYDQHYPKEDRPRRNLLMKEFVRRASWLCLLAETAHRPIAPTLRWEDPSETTFDIVRAIKALTRQSTEVEEFQQLDADVDELLTYLASPLAKRSAENLSHALDGRGLSLPDFYYLLPRLAKRVAGHQVTARLDAVRAADMFDAGLSWTQIAQKLYGCKDAADCSLKRDRIRKAKKALDELFEKFRIPLPKRKGRS